MGGSGLGVDQAKCRWVQPSTQSEIKFLTATRDASLVVQNFSGKGQTKLEGFCSFQKGGEHRQATPSLNELARKLAEGQQLSAWQVHLLSAESVD